MPSIGAANVKRLERMGIHTLRDLLQHYPRRYEDLTLLTPVVFLQDGIKQVVRVRVEKVSSRYSSRGRRVVEAYLSDDTGRMKAMWFNQPYMEGRLHPGEEYTLTGKVSRYRGSGALTMMNPTPEIGQAEGSLHTGRLVPVYSEAQGLTTRWFRNTMADILPAVDLMAETLPPEVTFRHGLPPLSAAMRNIHFPPNEEQLERARRRVAFEQLLVMQLQVLVSREERLHQAAPVVPYDVDRARAVRDALPFQLTNAQRKAAHQVFTDMAQDRPMARLLQGDVGSGKTAIAALAVAMVAAAGRQALFMAPTEILAQQHARTLRPLLAAVGVKMEMLVGSTPQSARRTVLAGLADGFLDVVVGTHALIEDPVQPKALALVVTDEQHRFGVAQREALARKAGNLFPHVLSMTATPIPRTLQLTLYGDLAVSVLDEMPPGRTPVETRLILPHERDQAYDFLRQQVAQGRQAFVICPLVEDSELVEARSATSEHRRLQDEVFPDLKLALLHGRMKPREKDAVMEAFKAREFDVLVSTSVVEVGVDVPNASVMVIEGADRFGLAQLHQLRGRVGRAQHQSFCLLCSDVEKPDENRRLDALVRHSSGFDLAEVDLLIRGPGDVLGTSGEQSGFGGLMVAGLLDARLIAVAREEAETLIAGGLDRYPGLVAAARGSAVPGSLS